MKTKNDKNKKGISLIVLVITIIVMVILAGAIVITLNNSGIINKASEAVEQTNLATVKELAQTAWAEAYMNGAKTDEKFQEAVEITLEKNKIDVSKYKIVVTTEGVTVRLKTQIPEEWQTNVVDIVDDVPIPKGFVVSPYDGENTKNGGLVIYELAENETEIPSSETHHRAMTTRNQYVWVPVAREDFVTKFVRKDFINTTSKVIDENGNYNALGTSDLFWEVMVDENNMPLNTQDENYMTSTTLAEVQAMYESVKEYEGFYIARYEAGIDTQRTAKGNVIDLPGIKEGTKVYSVMGKIPYTYIPWTWNNSISEDTNGAVEVARRMYPNDTTNTTGVVSTLAYGVQWDRTLAWWLEVGAKDGNENVVTSVTNSTSYGNYMNHVINSKEELNEDVLVWDYTASSSGSYVEKDSTTLTYPKASGTKWALSTGALKVARVNNIYDMAGNMYEWTMEGYETFYRVLRGGIFDYDGSSVPVSSRVSSNPGYADFYVGFRSALYIKK